MTRNLLETILGAVVLCVAGGFLIMAYFTGDFDVRETYSLKARFNAVDGLTNGSDIRIGGVKIGSVQELSVDPTSYEAVVSLAVYDDVQIPNDSLISISSNGLLGGKYVKIAPGASRDYWQTGDVTRQTKDVVSLEELLGKVIFMVTDQE